MNKTPYILGAKKQLLQLITKPIASGKQHFVAVNKLLLFGMSFLFLSSHFVQAQCIVSCKSNLQISLDANGIALITPQFMLTDQTCNPADFTVNITDANNNSIGNTLTCSEVNQTVTAMVTHNVSGNYCSGTILVKDNIEPVINCTDLTLLCIEATDPASVGYPSATDNCTTFMNQDLNYSDNYIDLACLSTNNNDTITSKIERTWSVADASNNMATCIQTIYLKRATVNDVVFPPNRNGIAAPALDCQDDPNDLTLTGQPTINGYPIDPLGSCELFASFTDIEIGICGPTSYQVLRNWTVSDWCTGDYITVPQLIKLLDTTAPEITCPENIVVSTGPNSCDAALYIPTPSTSDDCSNVSLEVSWPFGNTIGLYQNIPLGQHALTYLATDDCGNEASCQISLTVEDHVPPVPVCDATTVINLDFSGMANVNAAVFNDGSFDNCALDYFEVSRDGVNFGPTVDFTCADFSNPVMITLMIYDEAGNSNQCEVEAIIQDNIAPLILAPADIYLTCVEDYNDVNITGLPTVADNCEIEDYYFTDDLNLNTCGVGSILRTWTVVDVQGLSASDTQLIYLEDDTPIQVSFPQNYTSYVCGAITDPSITGEPVITNDDCEFLSIDYDDNIFTIAAPACYKILRTWEVIDWCVYDANSNTGEGYWIYIQEIDILDNEAPIVNCLGNITVQSSTSDCNGAIVSIPELTASDCSNDLTFMNDSPYASQGAANASGYYPMGVHIVNFTISDGCGNSNSCSIEITVVDGFKPTPVCQPSQSLSLSANGSLTINPNLIDAGSYDNCTSSAGLSLSISPDYFTCDDLGWQQVTLTVSDEASNNDFCTTSILIQDNMGSCPEAELAGAVITEVNDDVEHVMVEITEGTNTNMFTGADGWFGFPGLPTGSNYMITPVKDINDSNGISTFDLIIMSKHILGIEPLDSPYKMIAADINLSGNVSTFDIVQLRKLILNIDTAFTVNDSWKFVDADYVFPDPNNPFYETFPEHRYVENLSSNQMDENFIAIKIGDLNNSVSPNALVGAGSRNLTDTLIFYTQEQTMAPAENIQVPIYARDIVDKIGFQFTLQFDNNALDFLEIKLEEENSNLNLSEANFGLNNLDKGIITLSWHQLQALTIDTDTPLFYLNFKAKKTSLLSQSLRLVTNPTIAEAYDKDANLLAVKLMILPDEDQTSINNQVAVYPNPFKTDLTISLDLAEVQKISIEIYDAKATLVYTTKVELVVGANEIKIPSKAMTTPGLYWCKLVGANQWSHYEKLIRH